MIVSDAIGQGVRRIEIGMGVMRGETYYFHIIVHKLRGIEKTKQKRHKTLYPSKIIPSWFECKCEYGM